MLHWIVPRLLLASLVALALSLALRDRLPERAMIRAQLLDEPQQQAVSNKPFETRVGDVRYTVQPLFRYRIGGLVVSRHDIGLVGSGASRLARPKPAWSTCAWSGVPTCATMRITRHPLLERDLHLQCRRKSDQVWRQFDPDSLSNNTCEQ